jgi:hypothetical protein
VVVLAPADNNARYFPDDKRGVKVGPAGGVVIGGVQQ